MDGISFLAWLQITGPVFAAFAAGSALLWSQQQASISQLLEIGRAVGRLEGSVGRLEDTTGRLEGSVGRLEASVGSLDGSVDRLGEAVKQLSERVGTPRDR